MGRTGELPATHHTRHADLAATLTSLLDGLVDDAVQQERRHGSVDVEGHVQLITTAVIDRLLIEVATDRAGRRETARQANRRLHRERQTTNAAAGERVRATRAVRREANRAEFRQQRQLETALKAANRQRLDEEAAASRRARARADYADERQRAIQSLMRQGHTRERAIELLPEVLRDEMAEGPAS